AVSHPSRFQVVVFLNDPATPETYTLSLHDALPIWYRWQVSLAYYTSAPTRSRIAFVALIPSNSDNLLPSYSIPIIPRNPASFTRSEEHTSELQSRENLVCRLLLEKKNKI